LTVHNLQNGAGSSHAATIELLLQLNVVTSMFSFILMD